MTETSIARQPENKIKILSDYFHGRKSDIAKVIPPGMSVERVIKTAMLAAFDNPDIGNECTPGSVFRSVLQACLMGLTIGNGYSEGYLIPYKVWTKGPNGKSLSHTECTFKASYIGWAKVAKRSDDVDVVRASVVYGHDEFNFSEHPPLLTHTPMRSQDRGEIVGAVAAAYKLCRLDNGRAVHDLYDFTFVDPTDLQKARKLADAYKASPAWSAWTDEMRKKVAIRRLCKMLPRNEQLDRLMRIENLADDQQIAADPDVSGDLDMITTDARFDAPVPGDTVTAFVNKREPPPAIPDKAAALAKLPKPRLLELAARFEVDPTGTKPELAQRIIDKQQGRTADKATGAADATPEPIHHTTTIQERIDADYEQRRAAAAEAERKATGGHRELTSSPIADSVPGRKTPETSGPPGQWDHESQRVINPSTGESLETPSERKAAEETQQHINNNQADRGNQAEWDEILK
jgi:phage RecT family recombinase